MTIIVTGCGGFIGTSLANMLLADAGVKELWNFDLRPLVHQDPRVKNILLDLRDPAALDKHRDLLQRADYLYHLAGVTKRNTLSEFIDLNVKPTRLLLERVKDGAIKRFLYVSSQSAASPAKRLGAPVREDEPMYPVEAYGKSKLIGESAVVRSGVPYVIVRPSSVYGPHDPDYREIFDLVAKGMHIYPSCRFKYYSAIYVEDLVKGMVQAATHPGSLNRSYFLTSHEEIQWNDVYNTIAGILGKKPRIQFNVPYFIVSLVGTIGSVRNILLGKNAVVNRQKVKLSKPRFWTCSVAAARKDFGFSPAWSLEAGLRETTRMLGVMGYLKI